MQKLPNERVTQTQDTIAVMLGPKSAFVKRESGHDTSALMSAQADVDNNPCLLFASGLGRLRSKMLLLSPASVAFE